VSEIFRITKAGNVLVRITELGIEEVEAGSSNDPFSWWNQLTEVKRRAELAAKTAYDEVLHEAGIRQLRG